MLTEKAKQIKKILEGLDDAERWCILLEAAPEHDLKVDFDGQLVVHTGVHEK